MSHDCWLTDTSRSLCLFSVSFESPQPRHSIYSLCPFLEHLQSLASRRQSVRDLLSGSACDSGSPALCFNIVQQRALEGAGAPAAALHWSGCVPVGEPLISLVSVASSLEWVELNENSSEAPSSYKILWLWLTDLGFNSPHPIGCPSLFHLWVQEFCHGYGPVILPSYIIIVITLLIMNNRIVCGVF